MSIVKSLPPRFSEKDVVRFAKELYGRTVSVRCLVSDIGQNFHLTDESGREYILKIANPEEREYMLEAQNLAVEYLANHNRMVKCPRVLKTIAGKQIVKVTGKDNKKYLVRLLTYLHGKFLGDVRPHTPELLHSLGTFLGDMDKTLERFHHPAANRYWHWDLKNASDINRYTNYIVNPRRRSLVEYFLLQFETSVLAILPRLRTSVIHNDANEHNVLVKKSHTGGENVVGIIDFGDMVHTCTVCELAIAIAYIIFDKEDPLEAAVPIVQGYHETFPLTELDLEVLFYLICARLCTSVTLSAYQHNLRPDDNYLTISERPAWALLEKLLEVNPEKAHHVFRHACGMYSPKLQGMRRDKILQAREMHIGKSLSISYQKPLKIIRGAMQYLYDETGRTYLDCVNNVCHVGHCHPYVVRAAQKQIAVLNTNTRYLHDNLVLYAQRLTHTLPEPLRVCFFVNSGSEANELALRLARTHTKQKDCIVVDSGYHGNTSALVELSPYKFDGPGGTGAASYIHKVMMPDEFRGPYKSDDQDAGRKYAKHVKEAISKIHQKNKGLAAFFCESIISCGGQIELPDNYLKSAYQYVREAGGVCVADEVQVGFGRIGSHFWGFETQGVDPDIVTLGKPIGNGHPLAAVITTPEIAESFDNGMEYFNTFGGNPVSCAVGSAVLDVIENENLQANALKVGAHLLSGLEQLKGKHPLIGDVRGLGLFIGIELVLNRETLTPAAKQASYIIEEMKEQGILMSIDGPLHNVLKIKPPLVFTEENVDLVISSLDKILGKESLESL